MTYIRKLNLYVALLRGVNVGGNGIVSMKALKASFEKAGFADVTTYINSGNVIFKVAEKDARKLEQKIEKILVSQYKLPSKVIVRSFVEFSRLIKSLPTSWTDDKKWKYNVIFLRQVIDSKDTLKGLDPKKGIEEAIYYPGTLLWRAKTSDLTKSSMLKINRQKIYQDMTVRNLNTTKKLFELMQKY